MIGDYDISLGREEDIPGILVLQEANLAERGGGLSSDSGLVPERDI